MAVRTSYGLARYQAAENDLQLTPRIYPGGVRGVLYCHGAGQGAAQGVDPTLVGQYPLLRAIAEYFPVIMPDLGGTLTWGNATVQTRCETARGYLSTGMGATNGKIHVVGASMGALSALQWAKANPTRVQTISLIIPALDIDYAYQNNIGSNRASIGTAWSVTFPTALPAGALVLTDTTSWDAIPLKAWYCTDDVYTPTASSTTFIGNCALGTGVSLGALGHTEAAIAAATPRDLIAFLQANN